MRYRLYYRMRNPNGAPYYLSGSKFFDSMKEAESAGAMMESQGYTIIRIKEIKP
jgi:hypothetical protein